MFYNIYRKQPIARASYPYSREITVDSRRRFSYFLISQNYYNKNSKGLPCSNHYLFVREQTFYHTKHPTQKPEQRTEEKKRQEKHRTIENTRPTITGRTVLNPPSGKHRSPAIITTTGRKILIEHPPAIITLPRFKITHLRPPPGPETSFPFVNYNSVLFDFIYHIFIQFIDACSGYIYFSVDFFF